MASFLVAPRLRDTVCGLTVCCSWGFGDFLPFSSPHSYVALKSADMGLEWWVSTFLPPVLCASSLPAHSPQAWKHFQSQIQNWSLFASHCHLVSPSLSLKKNGWPLHPSHILIRSHNLSNLITQCCLYFCDLNLVHTWSFLHTGKLLLCGHVGWMLFSVLISSP